MGGPDQAAATAARAAAVELGPEQLPVLQDEHAGGAEVVGVLHEAAGMAQAGHGLVVAVRAQVALGAVFDRDVQQPGRHHGQR